ncbi:MAG: tRNA uridine-5-carboxymethylaminomethyl(34) synthesis GTPase MnmE [Phenylobacterium sp.]|uniref:tRNA uridine-5-carboxymethylaminomethyl(34) synthesis GTPase MnmE n=1 Tax=Phenylobacterium sp. TaxID=1871053 RepID=UPI0025D8A43C|nr:tRNA uridine-5-carboxymethylaminomethyl(34) synthesis GTPase MnmE [Phenylobacterium sp.]MCA6298291.1 tRNA uridine-5-carboxymethylaminomethyl(34) synthesis GTPase MnmE [Phenylobacterium sp.]
MSDTVFAPATAPGRAAVAVVRLSGPRAGEALSALAGRRPAPRRAAVRKLKDAVGRVLDEALVLWMPGPASYTGEDSAELHLHGGPAVVAGVLEALAGLGLRLAEPGEFTRRAFENGRLDLAQAEGVADLIEAETEAQRRQALDQLDGALGRAREAWRSDLVEALALFEAAVDFPDEDLPEDVAARAQPAIERLLTALKSALEGVERAERVRDGYAIALIGAPNAGKSTLLNALSRREAAIVTATPGTTRDVIEVRLQLAGYKVILADTAGLRDTLDEVEAEGVRRARRRAEAADLRLWVVDGAGVEASPAPDALRPGDLCLVAKADLPAGDAAARALAEAAALGLEPHRLSAHRAEDIAALEAVLSQHVIAALGSAEPPSATRLRHAALLAEAVQRLESALGLSAEPELAAEDVRLAARALDRITGKIGPEDVLDRIFSTFCIGK